MGLFFYLMLKDIEKSKNSSKYELITALASSSEHKQA